MATPIDLNQQLEEIRTYLDTLVEVLIARGHLTEGNRTYLARLRRAAGITSRSVELGDSGDKYSLENSEVDCASRMHICKARCCGFNIPLTLQDLEEGKLRWHWELPYRMKQERDGYCSNMDRDSGRCGAYEHRPAPCRTYDCSQDARIWKDFEARIPADWPQGLIPPEALNRRP